MTSRSALTIGVALSASLVLTACGETEETTTTPETVTQEASETATTEEATSDTATSSASEETATQQGEDPVFRAIDAVLEQHSDGIIVDIDREDERDTYDIDIVVGDQVLELEVDSEGSVNEDEREGDDDDVREAQEATVSAADAIREALEQHPDGFLDEAQLDEDDGALSWEISLHDADGDDLAELTLPAT